MYQLRRCIGAPALAEGQEFFGFGHVFFVVGDDQPFLRLGRGWGEDVGAA